MPDTVKDPKGQRRDLPKDLDMPAYRYQRADSTSFTMVYSEKGEKKDKADSAPMPSLAALSFSC